VEDRKPHPSALTTADPRKIARMNRATHRSPRRFAGSLATALLVLGVALPASAIQPGTWTHTTEADFTGETDNTVVTNLGDIKLSARTRALGEAPEDITVFNDIQRIGDTIYIAAGPQGALLVRGDDELQTVLTLDNEQVFALAAYRDQLLVAISGADASRLAVLDGEELRPLVELPGVRYIWDVLVLDDALVLATGTEGKVLRVLPDAFDPDAEENPGLQELLDATQANILCLAADGQGRIYAGTDTDGLVFRLTPDEDGGYSQFVMYDAAEPEIGALLVMEDGTVYAGTADADQARPGRLAEATAEQAGRPDTVTLPDAVDEGELPEPGDLPQVPPDAEPIGDPDGNGNGNGGNGGPDDGAPMLDGDADAEPMAAAPPPRLQATGDAAPAADAADDQDPANRDAATPAAAPTAEQYDRLRSLIRQRLESARRDGTLQVGAPRPGQRPGVSPAGAPRARPAATATATPTRDGNAVYRIDTQGFVAEVFRESVMILRLVRSGDRLLVATGNQGQVFSIDTRAEETTTIADTEPEQVTALLVEDDGDILMATANPARLLRLSDGVAERGTYTSQVLDAAQISLWGSLHVTAEVPDGTRVLVQTRGGNVSNPDQAPWSDWSEGVELGHDPAVTPLTPRHTQIGSPPARFLQYRLTLDGADEVSPVVDRVEVTYVTPNMRPRITSLRTSYPDVPTPGERNEEQGRLSVMTIEWEASDPNNDELIYRLEYQPAGSERWLLLADDIRETRHEWQTRRVPDGRYLIRVTADDRLSNPPDMAMTATRRSDPVLVDNTPPRVEDLEVRIDGRRAVISGTAVDAHSRITSIAYVHNAGREYRPVLPTDLIFDSTRESFEITMPRLAPGPHVVTLRVIDARGNTRFEPVLFDIN
jgi:hypothetical protein